MYTNSVSLDAGGASAMKAKTKHCLRTHFGALSQDIFWTLDILNLPEQHHKDWEADMGLLMAPFSTEIHRSSD